MPPRDKHNVISFLARPVPRSTPPPSHDEPRETPLSVLVIDETPADRTSVRHALTAGAFVLQEAANGQSGLAIAASAAPDCILIDHNLPDVQGIEVLRKLAAPDGSLPCAVVMLTRSGDAATATAALKAGAHDYIVKDRLDDDTLQRVVRIAVRQHRLMAGQRSAERRNAHLAAIVAASCDAIISVGLDSIVQSWNAGAELLFGWGEHEAVGQPVDRLIVPETQMAERAQIYEAVASGKVALLSETVRRTKDGRLVPVEVSASPVIDGAGQVVTISVIFRNLSDRKAAEAHAANIRSAFAGDAAPADPEELPETTALAVPSIGAEQQLAATRHAQLLDVPPDPAFDRFTRLASGVLQASTSLITVVD